MEDLGLVHVYFACLAFGIGYALLMNVLSHLGGGSHDGSGGLDVDGDADPSLGLDGPVHGHLDAHAAPSHPGDDVPPSGLSPFSPMMIATFTTALGSFGLITLGIGRSLSFIPAAITNVISFVLSAALGLVTTSYLSYYLVRLLVTCQSNTQISNRNLIGVEAEVILDIPPGGIGEVAYILGGGRQTNRAKALEPTASFGKGATVEIVNINENIFYVRAVEVQDLR